MRLKRFLFPWERLYFILDANSDSNPFRKGEYALLRYIRKEPMLEDQDAARPNSQRNHAAELKVLAGAVAGAPFYSLSQLIFPSPRSVFRLEPSPPVYAHPNVVIDILWQISQLPGRFEVVCILAVVFTVLTVYRYRRPGSLGDVVA